MLSVRVWNLQSDSDAQAVEFLENEFSEFRQRGYLAVRKTGRSALRKCRIKSEFSSSKLSRAIQHYLNQDDYIIFVVNSDNPSSDYQEQREPKLLVNQIKRVVKVWNFSDKVVFTPEVQEFQSPARAHWEGIVSEFLAEPKSNQEQFQERWNRVMVHFHNVVGSTSDSKLTSDLDAAIERYQGGEVTLGRASELAGLHRFEFEEALKARGIPKVIDVDPVEVLEEGISLIKSLHESNAEER